MSVFGKCNLCNGPVIRISSSQFGQRCIFCRSTPIHRALGLAIAGMRNHGDISENARVYEMSSRGAFFDYLSKYYRNLTFSEYYDDVQPGSFNKNGIQCQDVQALTFPDEKFDLITSTEVFEHVANDLAGFSEVYRTLKPGGLFVFTVPLFKFEQTIERAKLQEGGNILHLLPPEYHGDRIRGKTHVLAFRNYGQDIVDRLGSVGFAAEIQHHVSKLHRISDNSVIVARKLSH